MQDPSHSDIPLPPFEKPGRKWLVFALALAGVLALIAAFAWYCTIIDAMPAPNCVTVPPSLDAPSGTIGGTQCSQGAIRRYRCEPLLQRARELFGRGS